MYTAYRSLLNVVNSFKFTLQIFTWYWLFEINMYLCNILLSEILIVIMVFKKVICSSFSVTMWHCYVRFHYNVYVSIQYTVSRTYILLGTLLKFFLVTSDQAIVLIRAQIQNVALNLALPHLVKFAWQVFFSSTNCLISVQQQVFPCKSSFSVCARQVTLYKVSLSYVFVLKL